MLFIDWNNMLLVISTWKPIATDHLCSCCSLIIQLPLLLCTLSFLWEFNSKEDLKKIIVFHKSTYKFLKKLQVVIVFLILINDCYILTKSFTFFLHLFLCNFFPRKIRCIIWSDTKVLILIQCSALSFL